MSGSSVGGSLGTLAAIALAPETGGMSLLAPALGGAAGSAVGGYLTGDKNILKNAALGGIGGGITGGLSGGLGSLFSGGAGDAATEAATGALNGAPGALSQASPMFENAPDIGIGALNRSFDIGAASPNIASQFASGAAKSAPGALSGIGDKLMGFAPYAGIGLAGTLADRMMAPKQVGPEMRKPLESRPVSPLSRTQQSVDPHSFFTSGGNRNFYNSYGMNPQYFAKGGEVDGGGREESNMILARMGEDHPMIDAAAHIVNRYNKSDYPGSIYDYAQAEYGDAPVVVEMIKSSSKKHLAKGGAASNTKKFFETKMPKDPERRFDKYSKPSGVAHFDDGGSASTGHSTLPVGLGRHIRGKGDGQSDDIPAMLSDGEFVISAPVVSAIGKGSNDAGARKLSSMQKSVMGKSYKKGKPPRAVGLGSYH